MGTYGKFVLFLLGCVVVAAVVYALVIQFRGGDFTFFSKLFEEHRDWLPRLPGFVPDMEPKSVVDVKVEGGDGDSSAPARRTPQSPSPTPPAASPQPSPQPTVVPPQGFTVAQLSPYYKKVSVSSINSGQYGSSPSQFKLQAVSSLAQPINVTGWVLRGYRQELARIPQGIAYYNPATAQANADILLGSGDYALVYGAMSPVGKNFRLNKCSGYLNAPYKFSPQLSSACPATYNRSEIIGLSGACQNLISSFSGCRVPTTAELNRAAVYDNGLCRAFLDRFNYSYCFNKFWNTAGFLSHEWRVWLNQPINFDAKHDRVLLYDKSGLLVNEYIY